MPKARGKTPGWAAVDLKLRHGGDGPDLESDPFPPVQPCQKVTKPLTRPMSSSIIVPPSWASMPTMTKEIEELEIHTEGRVFSKNYKDVVIDENVKKLSLESLIKRYYCMADPSLIEDVLIAVDNDFDSASRVLDEMYPCRSFFSKQEGTSNGGFEYSDEQSDNATASIKRSLDDLKLIPSEPEWEEDDVYLNHRKDAIKLTRSAAQHSRMASSAFLKGDHYAAQQHSSRAREDWLAANNLNVKAAEEILRINNEKNDSWKLDLHGLHAVEAVKALQNHLTMIETQSSSHRSVSPKRVSGSHNLTGSSSSESLSYMITGPASAVSSRKRPATLQVITGRGLHSKGHAALPAAVRGYLDENGYRYDETRPGVISVRPKFHRDTSVQKVAGSYEVMSYDLPLRFLGASDSDISCSFSKADSHKGNVVKVNYRSDRSSMTLHQEFAVIT